MTTPFQDFVNAELPKRPSTIDGISDWTAGKALVTTGLGLGITAQSFPPPPVSSVNGDMGNVVVSAISIGAIPSSEKGADNGVAELVGGVIPSGRLPSIAVTEYLGTVGSQESMLSLVGEKGDWCTRTDEGLAYIITGTYPGDIGGWTAWPYPTSPVISVNGQTGIVVLSASDVGADTSGAASSAMSTHTTEEDPHPQYATHAAAAAAAPVQSVNGQSGNVTVNTTGSLLTGLAAGSNTSIQATDTVLAALANLQAQISAGSTPVRATVTKATATIAVGVVESGVVAMAKSYRVTKIVTDRPARVRLYATIAQRDADASRAIGTAPSGDHGLLMEVITGNGALTMIMTPQADGTNFEATPDANIPYCITNLDASTSSVSVTFTYIRTE